MDRRQFLFVLTGTFLSPLWWQTDVKRRIRCPILMYHYLSPLPENADAIRADLTVVPSLFDSHCAYLSENGYTSIKMMDLYQALFEGTTLPEKPMILTFDDGYADAYEYALPTLQKYNMVGTFFIVSHFMESPNYLSWGQAELLLQAGMEVENHSLTHANLSGRDDAFLMKEIEGASEALRVTFGYRSRFFCYPSGRFDENTIRVVQDTGHLLAVTTQDGMIQDSSDPYRLPRVRMRGTTTVEQLAWLLAR